MSGTRSFRLPSRRDHSHKTRARGFFSPEFPGLVIGSHFLELVKNYSSLPVDRQQPPATPLAFMSIYVRMMTPF